ncbi:MAG: hypothetical protein ACR2PI_12750, partial [Hyphomicrobiaceae bacterium]
IWSLQAAASSPSGLIHHSNDAIAAHEAQADINPAAHPQIQICDGAHGAVFQSAAALLRGSET